MTIQLTNHDPKHWRDLAQQKRDMAGRMRTIAARTRLIHAAEYYEQMAKRAEASPDEPDSLGG
jgi:hypothetical protein